MSSWLLEVVCQPVAMQYESTDKSLGLTAIHAMNVHLLPHFPTSQTKEEEGLANGEQPYWIDFSHPHPPG